MKTSVTKIMMSFALMGCLIFGASDASAQGRSRSQGGSTSSRSQSAAVSRSNSATAPTVSHNSSSSSVSRSSATPQVNRSSSSSSSVSRSASTPQVNRSSSSSSSVNRTTSSSSSVSRSTATPQVNRSSSSTSVSSNRGTTTTQVNRSTTGRSTSGSSTSMNRGATTRGGNDKVSVTGTSTTTRRSDSGMAGTLDKTTKTDRTSSVVGTSTTDRISGNRPGGTKPNGDNGGNGKPNGGNGGHDKPNGGNGGHDKPNGGNGGHDRPNGGHGKPNGYDNHNHFDYGNHHYGNDFRRNYTNHSWSWSRPLPPPARPYRPLYRTWYRPVIPAGWYPYTGAPIIDRILGITFGTLFDTSIEYLYYNGYEIDGYADHILYLRNVPLLNLTWDDVMLCYDSRDRLVNAQFVFMSSHNNNYRYERVYRNLCRVYGTPFSSSDGVLNWYGGNNTGWITLSTHTNLGYYYTTLSIGY